MKQEILDEFGQAEVEQRTELEEHPLGDQLGPVVVVVAQACLAEEGEGSGGVVAAKVGLADPGELVLHEAEEVTIHVAELRDHMLATVEEEVEEERLERRVVGIGGVEVGEHAVAAGEEVRLVPSWRVTRM